MSYVNHLSRVRAQNYATGINSVKGRTVTIDTCSSCPQQTPQPTLPNHIGIQMLGQYRISNYQVHVGTSFEDSDASSVCCVPFVPVQTLTHTKRLVRVTTSLIVIDPTPNRACHLFLSLFLSGGNVYNVCEEYNTSTSSQFSKTVRFDLYLDVPVTENKLELELCATCSSDTCYLSASRGSAYTQTFPVGLSYLSIEDIAGI